VYQREKTARDVTDKVSADLLRSLQRFLLPLLLLLLPSMLLQSSAKQEMQTMQVSAGLATRESLARVEATRPSRTLASHSCKRVEKGLPPPPESGNAQIKGPPLSIQAHTVVYRNV
jgi:hypothetical protein